MADFKSTKINDTGYLKIPDGPISDRPLVPQEGMLRYNTDFEVLECYHSGAWRSTDSGIELYYEGFEGSSLDMSRWTVINPNYGTVSVSESECTLTNTALTNQVFGIYSNFKIPVGATLEVRSKNTQARHAALIGIGQSPWAPFPHGTIGSSVGLTWYSRADNITSTISLRDEYNSITSYSDATQDLREYQVFKIRRATASDFEIYRNDILEKIIQGYVLEEDYYIYFSSDGWGNSNLGGLDTITVIDYVKVY